MLLANAEPLPRDLNIPALLADLPAQTLADSRRPIWFAHGQPLRKDADATRGFDFQNSRPIDDSLLQLQQRLEERLGARCEFSRAVTSLPANRANLDMSRAFEVAVLLRRRIEGPSGADCRFSAPEGCGRAAHSDLDCSRRLRATQRSATFASDAGRQDLSRDPSSDIVGWRIAA